jgi:hypothetical protein
MTGNLSRTVLRGASARESACLPDLTKIDPRKTTLLEMRIVWLFLDARS